MLFQSLIVDCSFYNQDYMINIDRINKIGNNKT